MESKLTVGQLIDSLSKYNLSDPVEVEILQYNKRYPVAYCPIKESYMVEGLYATKKNGQDVRLTIYLPEDENKYMMVQTRLKK